jgi:hypothetical protein
LSIANFQLAAELSNVGDAALLGVLGLSANSALKMIPLRRQRDPFSCFLGATSIPWATAVKSA